MTALVLGAAWPAAAAAVTVRVERDGDDVVIEASALLRTDASTAWRILTDYDRYPDFIPGLHSSRIVARRGDRLTVTQSGDAPLGLLRIPVDITYEVTELPPNRLESTASASPLRAFESSYRLTPTALGVRLDYAGRLTTRSAWLGRIEQAAMQRSVVRDFEALADEMERAAGASK
ncbi:MAG TPA: SRPBCC family protein [Casimicrobiaceae bacterium]